MKRRVLRWKETLDLCRCGFGEYQDISGQSGCKQCPVQTTTGGFLGGEGMNQPLILRGRCGDCLMMVFTYPCRPCPYPLWLAPPHPFGFDDGCHLFGSLWDYSSQCRVGLELRSGCSSSSSSMFEKRVALELGQHITLTFRSRRKCVSNSGNWKLQQHECPGPTRSDHWWERVDRTSDA